MRKPITDESNDRGHIDENAPQVIRYVSACDDHKFILDKTLLAEGTVTYSLLHPTTDTEKEEEPQKEENEEKKEEVVIETGPANKFIPDVTREPKLKFFKVPKLGCYLAVSLKYNSCLYDTSLDKAVESYYETLQKKEQQVKEIREHEEKEAKEREEKEATGEAYQPSKVEWPKVEEPPYQTHEREYILCIDTLGQDRILTEEERKFVTEIAAHVVQCWERAETEALTKDKLLRISARARDDEFREKELAELNDAVEKAAEEAIADETL